MKKLKYFEGKLCTILTRPAAKLFEDLAHTNVFVGLVSEVDEFGVWITQLNTKNKSFFFAHNIVGIIEEVLIPLNDEEAKTLKKELEKNLPLPEKKDSTLISLEKIKEIKRNANKGNNENNSP